MIKKISFISFIVLIILVGNSWVKADQPKLEAKEKHEEFRLSPKEAIKIAQLHISRSKFFDMTKNPKATQLFPLYNPNDKSSVSHFEVKVSQQDNPDAGYIIISTSEKNIPIPEFSTQGKTYTERLRKLSSKKISKVFWHGPTVAFAEDSSGNKVAYAGPELMKVYDAKKKPSRRIKPLGKEAITPPKRKQQGARTLRQWKQLKRFLRIGEKKDNQQRGKSQTPYFSGGGTGNPGDGIEYGWYNGHLVTGWDRIPLLSQIEPNTPPNDNDFKSGCGPTAWAGLTAWHDMNWDPDLLYGNHWWNSSYIERLMMVFNKELGTLDLSGLGFTWPEDMRKGFDVIKDYLLHGQGIDLDWYIWDHAVWAGIEVPEILRFAYDMMYLNDCPTIVGYRTDDTSGHYALGLGVALNKFFDWELPPEPEELDDVDWSVRWGYVQVNPKSDFNPTWIDIQAVYGIWCLHKEFFGWNCPRKRTLGFSSQYPMDIDSIREIICTTWRDNDGKININKTSADGYPPPQKGNSPVALDFSDRIRLDQFHSAGAISTCTWDYYQDEPMVSITPYIFLAWRDENNYINIAYTNVLDLEKKSFAHVVLPERFKTSIDPAIAIAEKDNTGPMLYVAYAGKHPYTRQGHLLIIELDTFFKIARDHIDRFPREYINDVQSVEESTIMGTIITTITYFTKAWFTFTLSTTLHVNLDSNGDDVALVWADSRDIYLPNRGTLNLYRSYAFDGHWGDCTLVPESDMYHISSWSFSVDTFERPAVLYSNYAVYLAWPYYSNRIIICRKTIGQTTVNIMSGPLLETSSSGPALHYITDTLVNRNMVLGWFGTDQNKSMNHRVVYCGVGLISDYDDLPK